MEFRKIKIADLIPASYNPRKKLKPGDKEYQKIKNSITEFGSFPQQTQMPLCSACSCRFFTAAAT